MRARAPRREAGGMSASQPISTAPQSTVEHLEEDALLAGEAAAGGLRVIEIGAVVLVGLLVCPPLAILSFLVVAPLLVLGLVLGLLAALLSAPYLLVHHFRGHERRHLPVLAHRVRHAAHAVADALPHRVVSDLRKPAAHR
jgi:hypothetical protein